MDKKTLIESATRLGPFSPTTATGYADKSDRLIARINEALLSRADTKSIVGDINLAMMKDNHANHVRFIASILKHFDAEVLTETVLWVFRAYRNRGFASTYWAAQLSAWFPILREELPREIYEEVRPLYEWMQVNIPLFEKLSHEQSENGESPYQNGH
jgi:hypothetical protein